MNSNFQARGKRGEIWLYDPIGDSFWGDAISAKSFQKELTALGKVDTINLHINSPGGDVFDGNAIYNQLQAHPADIIVDIDGIAASIASVIAMSGQTIRIAKNAMLMIHNPSGLGMGDSDEMRRVAALLDTVKGNLVQTYADRTGALSEQISAWMDDETWFTAEDAVQNGFATLVSDASKVSASFDLRGFRNVPKQLRARMQGSAPSPVLDRYRSRQAEQQQRLHAMLQR